MDDSRQPRGASTPPRPNLDLVPLGLILLPSGMRVDLTKADTLVGRHSSADVRLPLPDVSRQHCRFVFQQAAWHVMDLDSLNGVFVNNQRVKQAPLCHGDRVRIGGFVFQVELPARARATAGSVKAANTMQQPTVRKEQRRAS
jgi:pSer/pThr/pTyr-binding forkhead associated (FHA) protein